MQEGKKQRGPRGGTGAESTPAHPGHFFKQSFGSWIFLPGRILASLKAWEVLGMCIFGAPWIHPVCPHSCASPISIIFIFIFWESQLKRFPSSPKSTWGEWWRRKTLQGKRGGARELEHYFYTILKKYKFLLWIFLVAFFLFCFVLFYGVFFCLFFGFYFLKLFLNWNHHPALESTPK